MKCYLLKDSKTQKPIEQVGFEPTFFIYFSHFPAVFEPDFHIFGAIFGSFYTFSDIQMNSTIDLVALLERVPNATITVQLSDLNAFACRLIADTREEYDQEILSFTMSPTNVPHELSVGAIWHSRWHPRWHSTYRSAYLGQQQCPWSGKVPLTEDQIEELYQIGRTGALNFSFVETIG